MTGPIPIVALDVPDLASALRIVDTLGDSCSFYKVGSELFTAEGPAILKALEARQASVFLDLKFHDIPNTVRGAVREATAHECVRLVTVHASGGLAMVRAAVEARSRWAHVLAVTVLTSLDADSLGESWGREIAVVESEVLRLAGLAERGGAHGVVCSGQEALAIRHTFAGRLTTLVPGIRLAGDAKGDQARVVTPRQAAEAGAGYIVLGRAVTGAASMADAMQRVLADLS